MECNHEWYEGKCVHCHADPSSAAIIDQLRQQLTEARERAEKAEQENKRLLAIIKEINKLMFCCNTWERDAVTLTELLEQALKEE